jgi:excisionase family DNA binding protein
MDKLLTIEETAQQTGLPAKAIRNLIFRGRFPHLKIGGSIRISSAELDRFLTLSRRLSAEEAARRLPATPETGREAA